jgi:hypothetical protein
VSTSREGDYAQSLSRPWAQLRPQVKSLNEPLSVALDGLLSDQSPLQVLKAAYGQYFVHRGQPNFQGGDPGSHHRIPLALVLSGSVEVHYIQSNDLNEIITPIAPLRIIAPGEMFGVFESIDRRHSILSPSPWSLSAGSVSAIVLAPNNGNVIDSFINFFQPDHSVKGLQAGKDFWGAKLIQLANLRRPERDRWTTEVLVLPDRILESPDVRLYVYELAWRQSAGLRSQIFDELDTLDGFIDSGNQTYDAAQAKMVDHHIAVALGQQLAYRPAAMGELSGPFLETIRWILEQDGNPSSVDRSRIDDDAQKHWRSLCNKLRSVNFPYVLVPSQLDLSQGQNVAFISFKYANVVGGFGATGKKPRSSKSQFAQNVLREFKSKFHDLGVGLSVASSKIVAEEFSVAAPSSHRTNANTLLAKSYFGPDGDFGKDFRIQANMANENAWRNPAPLKRGFFGVFSRIELTRDD